MKGNEIEMPSEFDDFSDLEDEINDIEDDLNVIIDDLKD